MCKKLINTFILGVVVLSSSGCAVLNDEYLFGLPNPNTDPAKYAITPTHKTLSFDEAKKAVGGQLKDPYSARYDSLYYGKNSFGQSDKGIVCGNVNGKNSFGGYVGARPFIAYAHAYSTSTVVHILGTGTSGAEYYNNLSTTLTLKAACL